MRWQRSSEPALSTKKRKRNPLLANKRTSNARALICYNQCMETESPNSHIEQDEPHKGGSLGSVLAILLIVALLVIGAFYVWGQRLAERREGQVQAVPSAEDATL